MNDSVLAGIGRMLLPVPAAVWHRHLSGRRDALGFMSPDHHRVRNFVVRELPRVGRAMAPQEIAAALDLPLADTVTILDDLERHLTFLFRDEQGAVAWAYPVTVARTPHRVTYSSGETGYAA